MKTLIIAMLATMLAGCVTTYTVSALDDEFDPETCLGEKDNGKDVVISYGDSKIDVTYKIKVKKAAQQILVFVLDPDKKSEKGVNYEQLLIHITGKDNKSSWINYSIAYDKTDKGSYPVCVDNIKGDEEYEYQVYVPGVGTIDPRVVIEN